ncbi:helix-turn-helix domain-containing protein [Fredinandcohnia quinoae]|uniref:Helix-turn-helix domain-containing protein n=1 Tax=Fredinandcohnia quinoae TaxID=2918902 RepID=A0AAW5E2R1_9BACI|nr:helix-turn-helix domain-containing protein [Fredinandcohnia sp. SECRCQ15]MCH1624276.1 helix-turn-helix domain-containing protein [Fredinandcohnia sp. SECRCQ15]
MENIRLNVALLRRRVPNLTSAARSVGLRPATVSNLCTGKIPVGRSEVRTLVALADLAECSLDELIIRGEKIEMIETGIKTLDLFAPLAKGGTIGLVARPGMGQLVLLAEMLHRLKASGYVTVLLKPEGEHPEVNDIMDEIQFVSHTIEEAYEKLAKLGKDKEIAFAADRSHVISGEIQDLQERLQNIGIDSVTTFLVDLKGDVVDEDLPFGPLETLWQFDADLSARHHFPAVNPIYSTSSVLEGAHLDQTHLTIQQRAKKLLRRYRELRSLVSIHGVEKLPSSEIQTYKRGERLEAYLTQPFYVAEAFTGKKGESIQLQDTLNDIRKIMDGVVDSIEVDQLTYIGKLN